MTVIPNKPQAIAPTTDRAQQTWFRQLRDIIQSRVVETVTASVILSLALLSASAWNTWTIYLGFKDKVRQQFQLQELSGEIVHFDEVLTMSARMAASTGDSKWEKRYRQYEPTLDTAIKTVIALEPASSQETEKTDVANIKLVEMENQAFKLVRQGQKQEALQLLLSPEYDRQKQIYAQGIDKTITYVKAKVEEQLQTYQQRLWLSAIAAVAILIILVLSWLVILGVVRAYIRQRDRAQQSLLQSQGQLLDLNAELQERSEELAAQEQAKTRENEMLQAEVGNILDTVSAVEEGDLSVQAEVGEGLTGLVADTLNRLVEELNRIIATVLQNAQQVTQRATEVEQLALVTVTQAQEQSPAVGQVQALMEEVNQLAQANAGQAVAANEVVQQTQAAISQGQQEMSSLTSGIAFLDQETEQLLKRSALLKDFVELTAQFSRDEKRIAALTRVLALNASKIAARASQEQDPEQFIGIAWEFDAIANQINDLAEETNQSLLVLQQRSDQIQTVVSGLGQDVQEIEQLVSDFTRGVSQSNQVFERIQTVTGQLVQVEQQVNQSSQEIALAAQKTLQSVQDIASAATATERQALVTREQTGAMGRLASALLELVQFFRLASQLPVTSNGGSGARAENDWLS